jgi:hypothetical protein
MAKKRSRKLNLFEIVLELAILIVFTRLMFNINYVTGIFYLFAIGVAIWKGILFRKKNIAWMIILGTFLSYFAGLFIPYIVGSYLAGDIVSAIIILAVALLILGKAIRLKHGKK